MRSQTKGDEKKKLNYYKTLSPTSPLYLYVLSPQMCASQHVALYTHIFQSVLAPVSVCILYILVCSAIDPICCSLRSHPLPPPDNLLCSKEVGGDRGGGGFAVE